MHRTLVRMHAHQVPLSAESPPICGPIAVQSGAGTSMAEWHPRICRLYSYWQTKHPPNGLPGRQHIDPLELRDLLPTIWLLDVQREPFRLRYPVVGTGIVEAMGARSHRRMV